MKNVILVVLFLFVMVTVGHAQKENELKIADYKALAKACNKSSCCLASVRAMEEGNYLLDEGKTFKETTCPGGYKPSMMKCIDSYRWCEPIKSTSIPE
jgi:hypothetical protein